MEMYGNFMCFLVSPRNIVYRNLNVKSKNISNKKQHDCETEQRLRYIKTITFQTVLFFTLKGWCFSAPPGPSSIQHLPQVFVLLLRRSTLMGLGARFWDNPLVN